MIEQTRKQYAAAWKAWKKANRIRRALADLTGSRNGPGKAWADECRVILSRAERAHRGALRRQEAARAMGSAWRGRNPRIAALWSREINLTPPQDPRGYPPAI